MTSHRRLHSIVWVKKLLLNDSNNSVVIKIIQYNILKENYTPTHNFFQQYYTAGNIKVKYFPTRPLYYLISILENVMDSGV